MKFQKISLLILIILLISGCNTTPVRPVQDVSDIQPGKTKIIVYNDTSYPIIALNLPDMTNLLDKKTIEPGESFDLILDAGFASIEAVVGLFDGTISVIEENYFGDRVTYKFSVMQNVWENEYMEDSYLYLSSYSYMAAYGYLGDDSL